MLYYQIPVQDFPGAGLHGNLLPKEEQNKIKSVWSIQLGRWGDREKESGVSGKDPGMDHSNFSEFSMGERLTVKFLRQLILASGAFPFTDFCQSGESQVALEEEEGRK